MRVRSVIVLTLVAAAAATPVLAGFAGTDLFIPMAGRGVGAYPSNWFTTVYLYNPNPTAVTVDLSFLERNKDNVAVSPPKVTDTLAAGETKVFENIVETTFGKTAYGAVRIQCAEKVVATARVFSKDSADAPLTQSFGQDFAATPASFAIGVNESSEILGGYTTQPYQDSAARYNIGCVETTGAGSATVRWTARDASGAEQKHYDRVVPRLSQTQGFFHDYFTGVELTNARVSANVIAGNGKVICYGSLVTNDREFPKPVQDPTTFEMVYPEKLLGSATVQHDGTLKGDGTALDPLGLGDGAVSKPKLAAAAGAAGQVLGTTGSGLLWQDDGLKLPYTGGGSTSGLAPLLGITNSGPGVGIEANAPGEGQLGRLVTATAGVFGQTMRCGGDYRGVMGLSTCTGAYGELGRPGEGVRGDGYTFGVHGNSTTGEGVRGDSGTGIGISGVSVSGYGALGKRGSLEGYLGYSDAGVLGSNGANYGSLGRASEGVSGQAFTSGGYGVHGESTNGEGVYGRSTGAYAGVHGYSASKAGVWGQSASDAGVLGTTSTGYAGYFIGRLLNTNLASSGNHPVYADANGVLTNDSSDARLKADVVDLASEIDTVAALSHLRGVAFTWDTTEKRASALGGQRQIGLVAQEVEAVLPQVVFTGADGYKSIDYSRLTALLIEVAKVQEAEIAAQRDAIDGLRARVESLESRR